MQARIELQVAPETAASEALLKEEIREHLGLTHQDLLLFRIRRRSIDARGRKIKINLSIELSVNEALTDEEIVLEYPDVSTSTKTCHIVGAGPAGLFAALRCIELGIRPYVIERGKDVKARRRDLAALNREHLVNPESNYCFGEGGAGTYSDGKLYTRSNKRGDIQKILKVLVFHGASRDILVDAHPHIGTNKLPQLIEQMRMTILEKGGEVWFHSKLTDLTIKDEKITSIRIVKDHHELEVPIQQLILATGHSARDIYELLHSKGIHLEAKPFALGVRAEHPQELVDSIQYHCSTHDEVVHKRQFLPAASYSMVQQIKGKGVYSFCMCPGGIIAPCATAPGEVVTNGWSPSKRNNPYANSGIVISLDEKDFQPYKSFGPLAGLQLQKQFEQRAWHFGGERQSAPAQRMIDFTNGRQSNTLPDCSYQPGLKSVEMRSVLGKELGGILSEGFKAFGKMMRGYLSNDAVIVGVESRTSTPVRIPRHPQKLHHEQVHNLFPCGEGAGYAGGIVSAAMDGERCAEAVT
jgi:hypothetical protein